MDKGTLVDLIEAGMSQREIATELGTSHTSIRYWLKKHEISTISRYQFWDEDKFSELCLTEPSIHMVLVGMGVSTASSNYKYATRLADRLGVSLPVYEATGAATRRYTLDELFSNGMKRDNQYLRRIMVTELGIPDECVECGSGPVWRDKPITLQLDHIDGNNKNNMIENLRIMCPNCHSQTDTFCRVKSSVN